MAGDGDGGGERAAKVVVVGVKMESDSKELLTWALVKASLPGDQVIALHVLDSSTSSEGTTSLLSLVNTLDSVLSVYEGFCNLKQVDLKLKVCRGKSVRKILVSEAKSHPLATVVVGVSKTRHGIRSPASVAKHCARKLPRRCSVFAVENGRIVFKRDDTDYNDDHVLSLVESNRGQCRHRIRKSCSKCRTKSVEDGYVSCETGSVVSLLEKQKCHHRIRKSCSKCRTKVLEEECVSSETGLVSLLEKQKCHHRTRKSCSKCRAKVLEEDCVSCETESLLLPGNSATQSEDDLSTSEVEENPLALVPFQANQAQSFDSLEIRDSSCSKPSWALLRHFVFPKKRHDEKSLDKSSVSLQVLKLPRLRSSVIYPDHKQIVPNQDESSDHHCSALNGESGAIVPFGHNISSSPRTLCNSSESVTKELSNLNEKYSATCRLFSFQELLQATSNFSHENMVGRGGSGCVYRGSLQDGKEFAVKILKPSGDVIKEFVQEIEIITALIHKNIVSLFGFCFEDGNLLLVYDFLSRGSLEENLHGHKKDRNAFGWQERCNVALGVAEALDYLHCGCVEPVIHRDVKSSNILLSDDFEPQLSDFGLASWASASSHVICTDVAGTFGYLAPEYLMRGKVSDKIDVYAFGVVLLELLSGRKPIDRESPKGHGSLVMWAKPILKNGNVSDLLDPILSSSDSDQEKIERMARAATLCISHVPTLRPSISIVLKLLQGDEEVTRWAAQQVITSEDHEEEDDIEGEPLLQSIQSHINIALLDIGDDESLSVSSSERSISIDDYLRGKWSRSSSFD